MLCISPTLCGLDFALFEDNLASSDICCRPNKKINLLSRVICETVAFCCSSIKCTLAVVHTLLFFFSIRHLPCLTQEPTVCQTLQDKFQKIFMQQQPGLVLFSPVSHQACPQITRANFRQLTAFFFSFLCPTTLQCRWREPLLLCHSWSRHRLDWNGSSSDRSLANVPRRKSRSRPISARLHMSMFCSKCRV